MREKVVANVGEDVIKTGSNNPDGNRPDDGVEHHTCGSSTTTKATLGDKDGRNYAREDAKGIGVYGQRTQIKLGLHAWRARNAGWKYQHCPSLISRLE